MRMTSGESANGFVGNYRASALRLHREYLINDIHLYKNYSDNEAPPNDNTSHP